MADILTRNGLFPPELVTDLVNKVKGKSSLAALSAQQPIPFNGLKEFTFNMDDEVDIVAEGGAKSRGSITLASRTILPIKFEYGARMSDEFKFASEEEQIDILRAFNDGFAIKVARGLDIAAMHGLNPRSKAPSTVVSTNHFDAASTVIMDGATANDEVEAAIAAVQANDFDVTGMAMAPAFRSQLAAITLASGAPMFPELGWGNAPGTINGLPVSVNNTVAFNGSTDYAIIGDFTRGFRWGYSKQIGTKIIEYGDPDNSGRDLQGHNEIYIRAEVYLGWAILETGAFAIIRNNPLKNLTVDFDIPATTDLLGKSVTDLQENVSINGDVISGILKYVADYSSAGYGPDEKAGNFIAFHVDIPGCDDATITATANNRTKTFDDDGLDITRVSSTAQTIVLTASKEGYTDVTKTLKLTGLTLNQS